jgi:hypothetical protein
MKKLMKALECIKDDRRMLAFPTQGIETRWQAIKKRKK